MHFVVFIFHYLWPSSRSRSRVHVLFPPTAAQPKSHWQSEWSPMGFWSPWVDAHVDANTPAALQGTPPHHFQMPVIHLKLRPPNLCTHPTPQGGSHYWKHGSCFRFPLSSGFFLSPRPCPTSFGRTAQCLSRVSHWLRGILFAQPDLSSLSYSVVSPLVLSTNVNFKQGSNCAVLHISVVLHYFIISLVVG